MMFWRIGKSRIISLITCLAVCSVSAYPKPSEKTKVFEACKALYGSPADETQNLFLVNQFYVLRLRFDRRGKLKELAVEPKYFFEETHPEWAEPDNFAFLTKQEYEVLLTQLDSIKPKGVLMKPAFPGSVVTNMTSYHREVHLHAVLQWGELVDLRRGENAPVLVRWVRVFYS